MKNKLSQGTQEVELRDVCEILTGFAFKSALFNDGGNGLPIIRIRNLLEGKTDTYYSGEYEKKFVVKKGDFLISMDGEFKVFEWKSNEALLNQRVCKLTLNRQLVDPKYIYYMISKKLKEIEDKTPFVTVKHISSNQIMEIKLMLPPLPTQKSIVSILEKAEALKKKREEADKLTKEYLQSVFYEMFLNKKFEEVELREIARCVNGFAFKSELFNSEGNGLPLVRIRDLARGKSETYYSGEYKPEYIVREGDFLIGMDGEFKIYIWKSNNSLLNQRVCRLVFDQTKVFSKYVFHLLNRKLKEIEDKTAFVTVKHISSSQIELIKIPLPPLPLQEKFASIVEKVEKLKEKQKESKEKIDDLFNVLMQKAFKGELVK